MNRLFALCLFLFLSHAVAPTTIARELSFSDVQRLARDAVRRRTVDVSRPYVELTNTTVFYRPAQAILPTEHPIDYVLSVQIELEVARLSYGKRFSRSFFEPLVNKAEQIVQRKMLPVAYDATISEEDRIARVAQLHDNVHAVFTTKLTQYASSVGKLFDWGMMEGIAGITITSWPESGQLFVMHALEWSRIQTEGRNPISQMPHVPNGSVVTWSGSHVVLGKFDDGRRFGPLLINLQK